MTTRNRKRTHCAHVNKQSANHAHITLQTQRYMAKIGGIEPYTTLQACRRGTDTCNENWVCFTFAFQQDSHTRSERNARLDY